MNNKSDHTHLYVSLALLGIFAVIFFLFRQKSPETPPAVAGDSTPYELTKSSLSPEEAAAQQKEFENPALTRKTSLTKAQAEAQQKQMKDPKLTAKQN